MPRKISTTDVLRGKHTWSSRDWFDDAWLFTDDEVLVTARKPFSVFCFGFCIYFVDIGTYYIKHVSLFSLQPTHDPVCCISASDKLLILVSD